MTEKPSDRHPTSSLDIEEWGNESFENDFRIKITRTVIHQDKAYDELFIWNKTTINDDIFRKLILCLKELHCAASKPMNNN